MYAGKLIQLVIESIEIIFFNSTRQISSLDKQSRLPYANIKRIFVIEDFTDYV